MQDRLIYLILILMPLILLKMVLAYVDPWTTGMVIGGSVWSFVVGIFAVIGIFFLRFFFNPIKKRVLRVWQKLKRKD